MVTFRAVGTCAGSRVMTLPAINNRWHTDILESKDPAGIQGLRCGPVAVYATLGLVALVIEAAVRIPAPRGLDLLVAWQAARPTRGSVTSEWQ